LVLQSPEAEQEAEQEAPAAVQPEAAESAQLALEELGEAPEAPGPDEPAVAEPPAAETPKPRKRKRAAPAPKPESDVATQGEPESAT
jgi:hypothetical protein